MANRQNRKRPLGKLGREEAMKTALFAEILREVRHAGPIRDTVRRALESLPPWTPFEDVTDNLSSPLLRAMGLEGVIGVDVMLKAQETLGVGNSETRAYENSRYFVQKTPSDVGGWQLSIRNKQNDARHDWREFQRIKNELCGEDCEAIEIYPAESRLVDTANQFYLQVLPPGVRVPFGFDTRSVIKPRVGGDPSGSNQRPWEPGTEPPDAIEPPSPGADMLVYMQALKELNEEKARGKDAEPEGDRGPVGAGPPGHDPAAGGTPRPDAGGADQAGGQPGQRREGGEGVGPGREDHRQAAGAAAKGAGQVQREDDGEPD